MPVSVSIPCKVHTIYRKVFGYKMAHLCCVLLGTDRLSEGLCLPRLYQHHSRITLLGESEGLKVATLFLREDLSLHLHKMQKTNSSGLI